MSPALSIKIELARSGFDLSAQFDIAERGITAVFGPSGAGKTTLLRAIAGLEQSTGSIIVAGETWQDESMHLPAHRRAAGFVMQESSLFDHLNVRENLEYGYKRSSANHRLIEFQAVVELLALEKLLARRPAHLSGGERKRTAIGRALLRNPTLLLLDEPLASLDGHHRRELMPFLERLKNELNIPIIYVSHSPAEVARLADNLVLMEQGRVLATGPINDVLTRFDLPVAHDVDAGAVILAIPGQYDAENDLTPLQIRAGILWVTGRVPDQSAVRVRVLARDVSLTLQKQSGTSILNIVPVTVVETSAEGTAGTLVKLDMAGTNILARVTRKSAAALGIGPGKSLYAQIKTVALLGP